MHETHAQNGQQNESKEIKTKKKNEIKFILQTEICLQISAYVNTQRENDTMFAKFWLWFVLWETFEVKKNRILSKH